MQVQGKVLYLSLVLSMAQSPIGASATLNGGQTQTSEQVATDQGTVQHFKSAGESTQLSQRINEPGKEEAHSKRQQKHAREWETEQVGDLEQPPDQESMGAQSKLQNQDRARDSEQRKDQERLREIDPQRDDSHTRLPLLTDDQNEALGLLLDPYGFSNDATRQRFSSSGSMYQSMDGDFRRSGVSSIGSHSTRGTGRGGGIGAGRR
jgi:hypothetical protein